MKLPEPSVLRRRFLLAVPAAVAATISWVTLRDSDAAADRHLLAALGLDRDGVRERLQPTMQRALLRAAEEVVGVPDESIATLTDRDLRTLVRKQIQEDYAVGRIAEVCGWRLSHTEIHCLATAVGRC